MHQHLVDHDLEEQRRDQREQLQEERGDQHLAEQAAVFVDGAQEPGDVEAPDEIGERARGGSSGRAAVPHRLELGLASSGRAAAMRGAAPGPCRRRPWPRTRKPPSRQAAMAGRGVLASRDQPVRQARAFRPSSLAQRSISGCADLVGSQPMPDLLAIGRNALQLQQGDERFEPRISRRGFVEESMSLLRGSVALLGVRLRQGRAAAGSATDRPASSRHGHRRLETKLEAMAWLSSAAPGAWRR